MLQLIYISTAVPGFDAGEVEAILATSRKNNRIDRITGLLLFDVYPPDIKRSLNLYRDNDRNEIVIPSSSLK